MKGFPDNPEGPLGPWYQKVNARLREARNCQTRQELVALLGEPDFEGDSSNTSNPTTFFTGIGSQIRFDDEGAEEFIGYTDPYRHRIRYMFALNGNSVLTCWKEGTSLGS